MNRKFIFLPVAVLIVAAGIFFAVRNGQKSGSDLKISGTVEVTATELSFKVGGRLDKRLVDEGETVTAGQLVATLEDSELRDERRGRAAEQSAARAGLADLLAGSRQEEIAQAEATLTRMQADAERLERDGRRAEELFRREVIPLKELEAARAARAASAAALREAVERLKLLKAGPRPDAVQQARARAEASSAMLALAETRLGQGKLTSPIAGVVLAKHAEPGELLAPGAPVVTVARLDEVWLRGYIPENELGRVKVGQAVRVTVDTWAGRVFDGRVSFISPQAEFTPKNVQTEKERIKLVYRVKITLPNPKMELKPGMPADAVIVTAR